MTVSGGIGSLINLLFRKPQNNVYNDSSMRQLSPYVREELLKTYYNGLGLKEEHAYNQHLEKYMQAQNQAFDKILEKHGKKLTEDQKTALRNQLHDMQAPVTASAEVFDEQIPGKAPTATHPEAFIQVARDEKRKLFTELDDFKLDDLLAPLVPAASASTPQTRTVRRPETKTRTKPRPLNAEERRTKLAERAKARADEKATRGPVIHGGERRSPPPPPPPGHSSTALDFFADPLGETKVRATMKTAQEIIALEKQKEALLDEGHESITAIDLQISEKWGAYKAELTSYIEGKYGSQLRTEARKELNISLSEGLTPQLKEAVDEKIENFIKQKLNSQKEHVIAEQKRLKKEILNVGELTALGATEVAAAQTQKEAHLAAIAAAKAGMKKWTPPTAAAVIDEDDEDDEAARKARAKAIAQAVARGDNEEIDKAEEERLAVEKDNQELDEETVDEKETYEEIEDVEELNPDAKPSPSVSPDLAAIKKELQDAQAAARKKLDNDLNNTITALHSAAQRERDLIGWLAAAECALRRADQQTFFGSSPDYTVMMTGSQQDKVQQQQKAIQSNDTDAIEQAGGLHTPSGIDVDVSKGSNGQLSFSIKLPALLLGRSYYANASHKALADLTFQAALVRGTGAKTIVTRLNFTNETMNKELARDAFQAALNAGFERKDITILDISGNKIPEKDLFVEKVDINQMGQHQQAEVNVDSTGQIESLNKQISAGLQGAVDPQEEQAAIKKVLEEGREERGLADRSARPTTTTHVRPS